MDGDFTASAYIVPIDAMAGADARGAFAAGGRDIAAVDGDLATIGSGSAADTRAAADVTDIRIPVFVTAGGCDLAADDGDGARVLTIIAADAGVMIVYAVDGQRAHARAGALGVDGQAAACGDMDALGGGEGRAVAEYQPEIRARLDALLCDGNITLHTVPAGEGSPAVRIRQRLRIGVLLRAAFVQILHHGVLIREHRRYGHIRRRHGEAAGGDAGRRVGGIVDEKRLFRAGFLVGIGQRCQNLALVRRRGEGDRRARRGGGKVRHSRAARRADGDDIDRSLLQGMLFNALKLHTVERAGVELVAVVRVHQRAARGHLHAPAVAAGLDVIRILFQAHGNIAAGAVLAGADARAFVAGGIDLASGDGDIAARTVRAAADARAAKAEDIDLASGDDNRTAVASVTTANARARALGVDGQAAARGDMDAFGSGEVRAVAQYQSEVKCPDALSDFNIPLHTEPAIE